MEKSDIAKLAKTNSERIKLEDGENVQGSGGDGDNYMVMGF